MTNNPHQFLLEEFQRRSFQLATTYLNEAMDILIAQDYGEWELKSVIAKQKNIAAVLQKTLKDSSSIGQSLGSLRMAVVGGLDVNCDLVRFDQWWLFTSCEMMDMLIGYKINPHIVAQQVKQNVDLKLNTVQK